MSYPFAEDWFQVWSKKIMPFIFKFLRVSSNKTAPLQNKLIRNKLVHGSGLRCEGGLEINV